MPGCQKGEQGEKEKGKKKSKPNPLPPEASQTSNDRFKHFPLVNVGITCYSNYMLWATVTVFVCWIVT